MAYAEVNGLTLYHEEHGSGDPLVLLHGGVAGSEIFTPMLPALAAGRRVIAVDLQGHGRTAEIDRPLRPELLAGDVAALIEQLGLERADVLGYSLGGAVAFRLAVEHPERVHRLILVSIPFRRTGSHPEVVAAFDAFTPEAAEMMKPSPAYQHYAQHAPRPEDWRDHIAKTSELLKDDFDWTGDVARITAKTLLVYADADSIRPDHIVEFFALLGGGLRDAGWDGANRPANQLAILPGTTHYDVYLSPALPAAVSGFLERAA
ncbi:MAG TPA: alpha/beta fold hydrolase [Solirubrobacteraceae bacterium]|nr:alpha/beta fold hydrolase [Solirubrobacteraceae bacterium]